MGMVSRSHQDRLKKAATILSFRFENPCPCDHCCERNKTCFIMPSGGKCAECERRGRPCVVSSWEALDRASDNLSSKISEDEKKVEQLLDELDEDLAAVDFGFQLQNEPSPFTFDFQNGSASGGSGS